MYLVDTNGSEVSSKTLFDPTDNSPGLADGEAAADRSSIKLTTVFHQRPFGAPTPEAAGELAEAPAR